MGGANLLFVLHFSSWHKSIPNAGIMVLTTIGFLLLLLPSGFSGRWLGLLWIMPLLLYEPAKPNAGEMWLTLLDVGQGLAVIMQTKNHILVYDTGPKYNANFDMGESVVLPFLYTLNVKKIDRLVISHGDNDHIGGMQAIINALPVLSVKTSVPEKINAKDGMDVDIDIDYCRAGDTWQWDQVTFSFLHPTKNKLNLGNNSSCVLRIDNGVQQILLSGDIEKIAEKDLLARIHAQLPATILIAPHHGSKTSALKNFVTAVHPQFVLYAIGYRNRYHFPHQSVVDAYQSIKAKQLDTAKSGAIQFRITKDSTTLRPQCYRVTNKKYWYAL